MYSIVHPCQEIVGIGGNKWSHRQPHSFLKWLWERAIIMWDLVTAVALKWPWNKVKAYLGLRKRILTHPPFSALIHAHFYLGKSVSRNTHWEDLSCAQQTFDQVRKHACSAVMDKKRFKELAEKLLIQATSHVKKDPAQSAHSQEPDKRDRGFGKLRFESAE